MSKKLKFLYKFKNHSAIYAVWLAFASIVITVTVFTVRFGIDFKAPLSNWLITVSYFNNLLTPIFLFITILLLYWTWRDTKLGLESQSHKFKLELFSRRASELQTLFSEKKRGSSYFILEPYPLFHFVNNLLTHNNLVEKMFNNFDKEFIEKHQVKEPREMIREDIVAHFIHNYINDEKFSLELITLRNESKISNQADLFQHIKQRYSTPDVAIHTMISYFLYTQEKLPFEIGAFHQLMRTILEAEDEFKRDFIEELLINFNRDVAKNLIEMNDDIPNNILDI